jgi:hypothetical protein
MEATGFSIYSGINGLEAELMASNGESHSVLWGRRENGPHNTGSITAQWGGDGGLQVQVGLLSGEIDADIMYRAQIGGHYGSGFGWLTGKGLKGRGKGEAAVDPLANALGGKGVGMGGKGGKGVMGKGGKGGMGDDIPHMINIALDQQRGLHLHQMAVLQQQVAAQQLQIDALTDEVNNFRAEASVPRMMRMVFVGRDADADTMVPDEEAITAERFAESAAGMMELDAIDEDLVVSTSSSSLPPPPAAY